LSIILFERSARTGGCRVQYLLTWPRTGVNILTPGREGVLSR
jgi:hypothetical protein